MPLCKSCALLPSPVPREGRLFLATPLAVSEDAILAWAEAQGISSRRIQSGLFHLDVRNDALERLHGVLSSQISETELAELKVLLVGSDVESLNPLDILRMESGIRFLAKIEGEWLVDLLKEKRLTTAFQPIVDVRRDTIQAYECLMRGQMPDGRIVSPGEILTTARKGGLLFHVDLLGRTTAIQNAAKHGISSNVFINFNPTSIYQPESCLRTTVAAAKECGMSPDRVVFEVTESEEVEDTKHLLKILDFYRNAGFRVALDDLGSGYSGLNLLSELRPDYVKLDMKLTRNVDKDPFKAHIARHLLEMAAQLGIQTVVEGVETAEEYAWARDHGATLAQGYYLAKPAFTPATEVRLATSTAA